MGLLKNVLYFIPMGSDKITNRESRIQNQPEQKKDKAQTALLAVSQPSLTKDHFYMCM